MKKPILTDASLSEAMVKSAEYASKHPADKAMAIFVAHLCGGIEKIAPESSRTLLNMLIPPASRPKNES